MQKARLGAAAVILPVLLAALWAYSKHGLPQQLESRIYGILQGSVQSGCDSTVSPACQNHAASIQTASDSSKTVVNLSSESSILASEWPTGFYEHQEKAVSISAEDLPEQGPVCHLQGQVDECCNCTYEAVDTLNDDVVFPTVSRLVQLPFFRYFKVNIYCDCPLWPDDSMCMMQACSVCECDAHEVPQPWLAQEQHHGEGCDSTLCTAQLDSRVDSRVEPAMQVKLQSMKGWRGLNNPWMAEGEENEEYLYINLLVNPERYTGYKGEHAHRIWSAIYSQSCFNSINCPEKRVFYRLISGMHASISAHISANYLLDEDQGAWGINLTDFMQRLGTPEARQRVENLYFAYLFVLRAVMKAAPLLERFEYYTGVPEEDMRTAALMQSLVTSQDTQGACPMPFDEGRLWKGADGDYLKAELQQAFQNITRIMDCVGCEKCKLWGKLQTLGIATALKILFSSASCDGSVPSQQQLQLERNEVIALINLLERFSNSLQYYRVMSQQLLDSQATLPTVGKQESVV